MALPGSAFPADGGIVVTFLCPNNYSYERLKAAADLINPNAGNASGPEIPEGRLLAPHIAAAVARNCEACEE